MSPYIEFGQDIPSSSPKTFVSLKAKGDKITFRILGKPYYNGIHFIKKDDGKWDIVPCPRINEKETCTICEKYFNTLKEVSKFKETDKALFEEGKKEAEKYRSTINIFFPILNREDEQFQIFQTRVGIKKKIDAELGMGIDVLKKDYIVMRTEQPGNDYYTLSRLDSEDTKPLSKKELEEVKKFKSTKLEDLVNGVKDDESPISETVDVDEIAL